MSAHTMVETVFALDVCSTVHLEFVTVTLQPEKGFSNTCNYAQIFATLRRHAEVMGQGRTMDSTST